MQAFYRQPCPSITLRYTRLYLCRLSLLAIDNVWMLGQRLSGSLPLMCSCCPVDLSGQIKSVSCCLHSYVFIKMSCIIHFSVIGSSPLTSACISGGKRKGKKKPRLINKPKPSFNVGIRSKWSWLHFRPADGGDGRWWRPDGGHAIHRSQIPTSAQMERSEPGPPEPGPLKKSVPPPRSSLD